MSSNKDIATKKNQMNNRLRRIDEIRGITLISMVLFHFFWDLNFIAMIKMPWFEGMPGFIWQQSICITFILVSGFSFNLGRHHVKRSLIVFLSGALVTAVTLIFTPESRVIFGVLTFIGSAGLIMIVIDKIHVKLEQILDKFTLNLTMVIGSLLLFIVFYRINYRVLFLFCKSITLEPYMFKGYFATYIGFCDPTFFSSDYFSILPWIFLYMAGYYMYRVLGTVNKLDMLYSERPMKWLSFIGRHTLIIYLAHQPMLYGVAYLLLLAKF